MTGRARNLIAMLSRCFLLRKRRASVRPWKSVQRSTNRSGARHIPLVHGTQEHQRIAIDITHGAGSIPAGKSAREVSARRLLIALTLESLFKFSWL